MRRRYKVSEGRYLGDYGVYTLPDEVVDRARAMNGGKSLDDRRTKGARHIAFWGKTQDATQETAIMLKKHFGLT